MYVLFIAFGHWSTYMTLHDGIDSMVLLLLRHFIFVLSCGELEWYTLFLIMLVSQNKLKLCRFITMLTNLQM